MKKFCIIVVIIICIATGILIKVKIDKKFREENAIKFSKEYLKVPEDNVFVYKTADEIIDVLKSGTGIVYIGYPECPWCQDYAKYLNEVAKEMKIKKILYGNTKDMKKTEEGKQRRNEIILLMEEYLPYSLDKENPLLYVPNLTFVVNGKIIGNNNATAIIEDDDMTPEEYWTEERISDLKEILKENIKDFISKQ